MKIQTKLEDVLVMHGLWADEAKEVVAELQADKDYAAMVGRWEHDASEYPPQMFAVLAAAAKHAALGWIDRKAPQHFARSILGRGE